MQWIKNIPFLSRNKCLPTRRLLCIVIVYWKMANTYIGIIKMQKVCSANYGWQMIHFIWFTQTQLRWWVVKLIFQVCSQIMDFKTLPILFIKLKNSLIQSFYFPTMKQRQCKSFCQKENFKMWFSPHNLLK